MVPYNTPAFSSGYASLLYGFVESKRLEGCKYNGEVKELQRLDRYFRTHGVTPADHPEKQCTDGLGNAVRNRTRRFQPGTAYTASFTPICCRRGTMCCRSLPMQGKN